MKDFNNILRVDDVSFDIHEGEIVGIAGVAGSGQSEIAATLMGLVSPEPDSEICFLGKDIKNKSVRERRALGIGYVPQDRMKMESIDREQSGKMQLWDIICSME